MGYVLGIDLGTSRTAAAVHRGDRTDVVPLSDYAAAMPSMIFIRDGDAPLVGEPARRRGQQEPVRLARAFKRRFGDTTPLVLGGTPFTAEQLTAILLRHVVDHVSQREGGPPDRVVVAHPANWGEYRRDLLRDAVHRAGLPDAMLVTEPEAAAVHHASGERMAPGELIAVYDLGGGTFDAAVLRRTATGFEPVGEAKGVERLGGIDFDEVVFAFVAGEAGLDIGGLAERDVPALLRLRDDCQDAKELLSDDREAVVNVAVGDVDAAVRITREQFESRIRPSIRTTVDCVRTAIVDAGLQPDQVASILMVGGSSRIPLAAEMVRAELGRPVAFTSNPKAAVALGAARIGAGPAVAAAAAPATPAVAPAAELLPPTMLAPPPPMSAPTVAVSTMAAAPYAPSGGAGPGRPGSGGMLSTGAGSAGGGSGRALWIALAAVSAVVIAVVGFLALRGSDSGGTASVTTPDETRAARVTTAAQAGDTAVVTTAASTSSLPAATTEPVTTTTTPAAAAPAVSAPPPVVTATTTRPTVPPPPALYSAVSPFDRAGLPDAMVPPANQSAALPDGIYFATVDFQPGTGAIRATIIPYFKGAACEQAAAEDGSECLDDTFIRLLPAYEVLVLDDVPVTLNSGNPDANLQLSIDELRQLIATDGTPSPGVVVPENFFFDRSMFVSVSNGEPNRLDGFFNP